MWEMELSGSVGRNPWKEDLPLSHQIYDEIRINLKGLLSPLHPMFAIRLRLFRDWHEERGRHVEIELPEDHRARAEVTGLNVVDPVDSYRGEDVLLPVTRVAHDRPAEPIFDQLARQLRFEKPDVTQAQSAVSMAAEELLDNAIGHSDSSMGSYIAALRSYNPGPGVILAVADLGIGIPEHLRGMYPEWTDDSAAIARAVEDAVTGTGDPQRGYGYGYIFSEVLTAALAAATMEIYSANGLLRLEFFDDRRIPSPEPAPRFRRGTCAVCDFRVAAPPPR